MKTKFRFLLSALALLAGVHQGAAQARFVRIVGPARTKITVFTNGTLVWTNGMTGTNYIVQTVASLPAGTNWVDYVQIPVSNSVNTNLIFDFTVPAGMAFVPAGLFTMGDTLDGDSDALPVNVTVSAFFMDVNLVTRSLWQSVHAYATNHGYTFTDPGIGEGGNYPVQTVNWYDVVKWCNARSQQASYTPVYYINTNLTVVYTNGNVDAIYPNWAANGYRLPTEAEWEKAARGGLIGQRFPWGDTISWSQANYRGDPGSLGGYSYDLSTAEDYDPAYSGGDGDYPYTSPVGSFAPNNYGLNDMAGNVFEWCWDWFNTPYAGGTDPRGPASSPEDDRVSRGGSWNNTAYYARCANRYAHLPSSAYDYYGFRCVMGF